jgi:hypothetical protein
MGEEDEEEHQGLDHQGRVGEAGEGAEEGGGEDVSDDRELAHEDWDEDEDKGEDEEVAGEAVEDSIEPEGPETLVYIFDVGDETKAGVSDEDHKEGENSSDQLGD